MRPYRRASTPKRYGLFHSPPRGSDARADPHHHIRVCQVYQTTLANVDYLHGSAEFMLTLTNLFIVVGLKMAIDDARKKRQDAGIDTD